MRYLLHTALAQSRFGYIPDNVDVPDTELPQLILQVVNWFLMIVGVLALVFLIYGGFLYITSHGDENQVEQAKKVILFAVIGIVVIGIAASIVNFVIDPFVGGAI